MFASRIYLVLVSFLLLGYAFLTKGFAYIGVAPIYVGEIVLGAGLVTLVLGGVGSAVLRSPITWALLVYASWGAVTTLPHIDFYGLDTLRDSVVWIYAAYAIFVAGALLRMGMIERPMDWYGRWIPWFLIWAPAGILILGFYRREIPFIPGSGVQFLDLKPGDLAVHMAGSIAFLALGLQRIFPQSQKMPNNIKEFACWAGICFGVVLAGSQNRGGLLAVLTVLTLFLVFNPMSRINRLVLPLVLIAMVLTAIDSQISLIDSGRDYSIRQVFLNVESIFVDPLRPDVASTVSWRLEWWNTIINYTVFGDYFWTGKGYGINLAVSDGFVVGTGLNPMVMNRSPHNAHLTILARSGVPGLVFWCILQATIFVVLLRRYFSAKRARMLVLANVNLWILAYWLALIVNMSFDVYLEGPQGGIWFWCLVGYIIALTLYQDSLIKQSSLAMAPPSG